MPSWHSGRLAAVELHPITLGFGGPPAERGRPQLAEDDLAITLENNQLVIRGRQVDDCEGRTFLHRGIAARQFQRSFVLADGVEVTGATLANGLLHIDLSRAEPETVVQTIRINGKKI